MATASLVQSIFAGLVHPTTGVALASAKCRFYSLGTLTPATVYSDTAAASAITPPLTLTAAGQGTVYTTGPVRCIVKDATDATTIYDVNLTVGGAPSSTFVTSAAWNGGVETSLQTILDNYTTAWGGSAGYWKYKAPGSGAAEVYPRTWLSNLCVQGADFGALADDATDNTLALNNALDALANQGGGVLQLGAGTYRITSHLSITAAGVTIRGSGRSTTTIKNMGTTTDVFRYVGNLAFGASLEDLTVAANSASTGGAVVMTDAGSKVTLAGITITGHKYGFNGPTAYGCALNSVDINSTAVSGARGVLSTQVAAIGGNWVAGDGGACVEVTSSGSFLFGVALTATGAANALISTGGEAPVLVGCALVSNTGDTIKTASALRNFGSTITTVSGAPVNYTATPFSASVATGTTTPDPDDGPDFRVEATGAASTVTVDMGNVATAAQVGQTISLMCFNNSGGSVTWAISGVKLDATAGVPTPSDGRRTTILFKKDSVSNVLVEIGRSVSVA